MSTDGYVAPYGLVNKVGFWYLVGFCHSNHIYRAFNLSYIKSHEMTNIEFVKDKDFDLEEFWRKSNPR
jgi:predicted DNA-binding transcriptional regulator YafY